MTDTSSGRLPSRLPGQPSSRPSILVRLRFEEMITTGRPLIEVLNALSGFIESQAEGIHCCIAFIDAEIRTRPDTYRNSCTGKIDCWEDFLSFCRRRSFLCLRSRTRRQVRLHGSGASGRKIARLGERNGEDRKWEVRMHSAWRGSGGIS